MCRAKCSLPSEPGTMTSNQSATKIHIKWFEMLIQLAYQHLSALPELNFRLQQLEKHKLPKGEFRDCASPHEPQDYESGLGEDLEITQKM